MILIVTWAVAVVLLVLLYVIVHSPSRISWLRFRARRTNFTGKAFDASTFGTHLNQTRSHRPAPKPQPPIAAARNAERLSRARAFICSLAY
ncbi:MAG TPA: hypothetical protein VF773_16035, partial [Verrucomicrobiae bacterium]